MAFVPGGQLAGHRWTGATARLGLAGAEAKRSPWSRNSSPCSTARLRQPRCSACLSSRNRCGSSCCPHPVASAPWLRPIVSNLQPVHPASAPFGGFAARLRGLGVAGLALRRVPRRGDWLTGQPSGSFRAAPDAGSGRAGQRGAGLRGTRAGSPPVLSSGPSSIRGTWAPLANPLKSPGLEMRASNGIACAV